MAATATSAMAHDFEAGGCYFNVLTRGDNPTVSLTYPSGSGTTKLTGEVTIPATVAYNDTVWTVVEIGKFSLGASGSTNLTKVTIPSTVKVIGMQAAMGNRTLETVVVEGNTLDSIGNSAFQSCPLKRFDFNEGLRIIGQDCFQRTRFRDIDIPNSVEVVGMRAFYACDSAQTITVGDGVTWIGMDTFNRCYNVKSVKLGKNVKYIGEKAFSLDTLLVEITLPAAVDSIYDQCFENNYSLQRFIVEEGNQKYKAEDGILFTKNGKKLVKYPSAIPATEYTIPSGVEEIGVGAFDHNPNLRVVNIPSSVTSIGKYAFWLNTELEQVNFSEGLVSTGEGIFTQCFKLNNVVLPSTMRHLGHELFYRNYALTNIQLNEGLETMGNYMFSECTALSDITYPSTLRTPGYHTFDGCPLVTDINVHPDNPYLESVDGVVYTKGRKRLCIYPTYRPGSTYTVDANCDTIGDTSFNENLYLVAVDCGKRTKVIEESAFMRCPKLSVVIMHEMTDSVGIGCFNQPYDRAMTEIYCLSQNPPKRDINNFSFTWWMYSAVTLYVPEDGIDNYKAASPWNKFENIVGLNTSSIDEVGHSVEGEPTISVVNGVIVVDGEEGAPVEVYTIAGQRVYSGRSGLIEGLAKGMYVVRAGNASAKVLL